MLPSAPSSQSLCLGRLRMFWFGCFLTGKSALPVTRSHYFLRGMPVTGSHLLAGGQCSFLELIHVLQSKGWHFKD